LCRRGAPDDVAAAVVADLVGRGDLDDAAFARRWVEARAARGYGASRLRFELTARGVARGLVDAALAQMSSEATLDAARAAARRRWPAVRGTRPERAAARLRDFLMRRGYPGAVVARVVHELVAIEE
jgi:regulatory protein